MATTIRIKVGCALDSGWDKPFASIESRSKQAAQKVGENLTTRRSNQSESWSRQHVAAERKASKVTKTEAQSRLAEIRREARSRSYMHRDLLREVERDEKRSAREQERIRRESARRAAKAERQAALEQQRFARRTSHRATRFFWPNAPIMGVARRGAMDLARGAGIETNLGGLVSRVVEAEKLAVAVSNQAYQAQPKQKRVEKQTLLQEAGAVSEETGIGRAEVLQGMKTFVDVSGGNLGTARSIAPWIAKMARSQQADIDTVMRVAAKMETALKDQAEYAGESMEQVTKRAEAIKGLMRSQVWQGKVGSVPIEEMAKQIPKLSGLAGMFEGDVGTNIAQLTALAQFGDLGVAQNAATAATFAKNYATKLQARDEKYRDIAGFSVFDKTGTKYKSVKEIMMRSIEATGQGVTYKGEKLNQLQALQKLAPNQREYLAMQKLQAVYSGAGGGQEGRVAMEKLWNQMGGAISQKQIDEDFAQQMDTAAAKAEKFNAQMERVVGSMAEKLIPAAEELAPTIIELTDRFGKVVEWAASNPGKAVTLAITGSIARAGLESAFRGAIEKAILASGTNTTLSVATSALTVAATAVTLYAAGRVIIDEAASQEGKGQSLSLIGDTQAEVELGNAQRLQRQGTYGEESQKRLEGIREQLKARIESAEERGTFAGDWKAVKGWIGLEGGLSDSQIAARRADAGKLDELRGLLERVDGALRGRLNVHVDNMPKEGPPVVDPSGRAPQ